MALAAHVAQDCLSGINGRLGPWSCGGPMAQGRGNARALSLHILRDQVYSKALHCNERMKHTETQCLKIPDSEIWEDIGQVSFIQKQNEKPNPTF